MALDITIFLNNFQFTLNNHIFIVKDSNGGEVKGKYSTKKINEMLENYFKNLDTINSVTIKSNDGTADFNHLQSRLPVLNMLTSEKFATSGNQTTFEYIRKK